MPHYILKPRQSFLEVIQKKNDGLDMICEGTTILGILTDDDRFPQTRKSIIQYIINVPEQKIEFTLITELNKRIYDYLDKYWKIE